MKYKEATLKCAINDRDNRLCMLSPKVSFLTLKQITFSKTYCHWQTIFRSRKNFKFIFPSLVKVWQSFFFDHACPVQTSCIFSSVRTWGVLCTKDSFSKLQVDVFSAPHALGHRLVLSKDECLFPLRSLCYLACLALGARDLLYWVFADDWLQTILIILVCVNSLRMEFSSFILLPANLKMSSTFNTEEYFIG